jgi:hypothetical protein
MERTSARLENELRVKHRSQGHLPSANESAGTVVTWTHGGGLNSKKGWSHLARISLLGSWLFP